MNDLESSDTTLDRILGLFNTSSKSDMELERDIGLPRSIIYDWRNKRSKSYKKYLVEIANYFGIPVSALYGVYTEAELTFEDEKLADEIYYLTNKLELLKTLQYKYNEACIAIKQNQEKVINYDNELKRFINTMNDEFSTKYYNMRREKERKIEKATIDYERSRENLNDVKDRIKSILQDLTPEIKPLYATLNDSGKYKVVEYAHDLIDTGKYIKK